MKTWSHKTKHDARENTIILPYRSLFYNRLPPRKQYWTMCGLSITDQCEYQQMLDEKLIRPSQFHGVEIDPTLANQNIRHHRHEPSFWYCNDFYRQMIEQSAKGEFNPGIVNVDTLQTPEKAAKNVGRIMMLLSEYNDFLLVVNVITKIRSYKPVSGEHVIEKIVEHPYFVKAYEKGGWEVPEYYYHYNGHDGTGRTEMTTRIFYRK